MISSGSCSCSCQCFDINCFDCVPDRFAQQALLVLVLVQPCAQAVLVVLVTTGALDQIASGIGIIHT